MTYNNYNPLTINTTYGKGLVEYYQETASGAYIHITTNITRFEIDNHNGILKSFAESLRKANFKSRTLSNLPNYDLSNMLAVCHQIISDDGKYINEIPIAMINWEKYGMEKQ